MLEKNKIVETKQLQIHRNTFIYDDAIIQMDNISRINVAPVEKKSIPLWSVICVVVGVLAIAANPMLGLCLICAGGLCIAYISYVNSALGHYLTLELNSGKVLYFAGKDDAFLKKIMRVMGDCMNNKNAGYTINMGQATITNMQIGNDNILR